VRPALLATLLLLAACTGEPPPKVSRGDTPPAFETVRLDGTRVQFPADFAGKPVVIRFWADWCKYCEGEMKDIEAVLKRHQAGAIEVLAVNAGQDRATVAAFVGKLGIGYPALLDEDAAIARRYGVVGLPTTYFIGRDGRVAAKQVGEMTAAAFEQRVAELVK
jgi:peroxiredoxin